MALTRHYATEFEHHPSTFAGLPASVRRKEAARLTKGKKGKKPKRFVYCRSCGRVLSDTASVLTGFGPTCAAHYGVSRKVTA